MINPGDILLFKAGDNWISKSIALLTKSDVSHAAMVYSADNIVEMTPSSGISVCNIVTNSGDTAYLMRHHTITDTQPLINAADVYINAEIKYDFPALVILAGLLIYREIRPTPILVNIVDSILRLACKLLDDFIQSVILHNPDKAMVCSQLVYQIYRDCGKDYEIKLEGAILQTNKNEVSNDGYVRLIDIVEESPQHFDNIYSSYAVTPEDGDILANRLYEALTEQAVSSDQDTEFADVSLLKDWVGEFLRKLDEFLDKASIPIDALFVTPGDLLAHAKNLDLIQKLEVNRV